MVVAFAHGAMQSTASLTTDAVCIIEIIALGAIAMKVNKWG